MRFFVFIKKPSTWTALSLFFPCALIAVYAMTRVFEMQRQGILGESIFSGTHDFVIEADGGCVGEVTSKLEDAQGFLDYLISGELRTRAGNSNMLVKLRGDAAFNAIGQLTAALLTVKSDAAPYFEAGIGLTERDPVKVSVWLKSEERSTREEFNIPGPFELIRVKKGEYRLKYTPMARRAGNLNLPKAEQVEKLLGFRIVPSAESLRCKEPGSDWLDTQKTAKSLLSALSFLKPLMDRAGMQWENAR